jgi:hypothetical protein
VLWSAIPSDYRAGIVAYRPLPTVVDYRFGTRTADFLIPERRPAFWRQDIIRPSNRRCANTRDILPNPARPKAEKSVFILSNNNNIEDTRVIYNNRKEIFESWKIYKKTCHLIIARLILRYVMIYEEHEYYTHSWLAIARDYQNFLLNFMPLHGKKQPILTRDKLWMVPSALDLADFSVPQWTLPSAVMDIVKRYRAPISH